jgi:hypothetical protein
MIAENVNTHAHGDVHLVVLAHLRRRWSLSGRNGFNEFSEVFFTVFSAPNAGPSVLSVVQRGAWPVLVTDMSGAEIEVSTGRVT